MFHKTRFWIWAIWVAALLVLISLVVVISSADTMLPQPTFSDTDSVPIPTKPIHPTATKQPFTPTALSPTRQPTPTNRQTTAGPDPFTSRIIIGTSVEGRPLEMYQFGSGPLEQLIVAGIHGGYEWNTVKLAEQLINYLTNNPGTVPENRTLYILKIFNPDGYARSTGISGRANQHNVDLNRNFPSNWQADWPSSGCWTYLPIEGGNSPASEPETRALMKFIEDHEIDSMISYHSAALGIFPGGQPPDPASISLAEEIAGVSNYPYPPFDLGCVYTGQLIDWASDQGIAAVDIELTNHTDTDFNQNLIILSVFLDWDRSIIND